MNQWCKLGNGEATYHSGNSIWIQSVIAHYLGDDFPPYLPFPQSVVLVLSVYRPKLSEDENAYFAVPVTSATDDPIPHR